MPARPPRTALLTIRVTPAELEQLNRVAAARDAPVSALLRPALMDLMYSIDWPEAPRPAARKRKAS